MNTLSKITLELGKIFFPLQQAFASEDQFIALLRDLGWGVESIPGPVEEMAALVTSLQAVLVEVSSGEGEAPSAEAMEGLFRAVIDLIKAIQALENESFDPGLVAAGFAAEFPRQLLDHLIIEYLHHLSPKLGYFLKFFGFIQTYYVEATETRIGYTRREIIWANIPKTFSNPREAIEDAYGWGSEDFLAEAFFNNVMDLALALGLSAHLVAIEEDVVNKLGEEDPSNDNPIRFGIALPFFEGADDNGRVALGFQCIDIPQKGNKLPGLALMPYAFGAFSQEIPLAENLFLQMESNLDFEGGVGLRIRPDQALELLTGFSEGNANTDLNGNFEISLVGKKQNEAEDFVIIGQEGGSGLSYQSLSFTIGLNQNGEGTPDFYGELTLNEAKFELKKDGGDGFLQKILPKDGISANFSLTLGLSTKSGFYIKGSGGLEITIPTHINLGPVEIQDLIIQVALHESKLPLSISTNIKASLGPLKAVVEDIGLKTEFSFPGGSAGNLGPLDVGFGLKPPKGVGLSLDVGILKGGGYLFLDFDRGEYAGALELVFSEWIAIKAIGLISTKMPDGSKGFSLLIILTVEFGSGLQLGFGFTLLGVGGILGLNRSVNIDLLKDGVRTNAIESVMFPQNVIENAPRIISDLRDFFPTTANGFLVGPMAKIGWGVPTLASVALGLIIEFPKVNITILGVVKVNLPAEEIALLRLQVNFIGRLEPQNRLLWFYAELYDSRLLFITLEGGIGLLVNWGDQANFVFSAGGFHPKYSPPPLPFPEPPRLAISILNTKFAKIRVEAYFAVTSNSVQFGAKAELFFGFNSFNVEGHLAFDALFQFNPFYFSFSISSSFSLKLFGQDLLSIGISGAIEGPAPWHIKGNGHLKILFFKVNVAIERTWGEEKNSDLPPVEVLPLFIQELETFANWQAVLPENSNSLVTLKKQEETSGDNNNENEEEAIVLHPVGHLQISQRRVPLGLTLEKFGSQAPSDVDELSIAPAGEWAKLDDMQEQFAIGQYRNLDDSKKLSTPDFEYQNSGIQVSVDGAQLRTSKATQRIIRYETVIIDNDFKRKPTPYYKQHRSGYSGLYNKLFRHMKKGNAASQSIVSRNYKKQSQPFEEVIEINPHQYSVARVQNNQPWSDQASGFNSYTSAENHLQRLINNDPNLADLLHVLPNTEINIPNG